MGCGKADIASSSDISVKEFKKPENYSTVLLVTINPQFRLYLDENGTVLAVEAVNKDAEDIKNYISFKNENYEKVIENIITTANENGFIKENANIKFEIIEDNVTDTTASSDDSSLNNSSKNNTSSDSTSESNYGVSETTANHTADILAKAESVANHVAESLKIKIQVTIESKSEATESSSQAEIVTSSFTPVHTHSFSPATCTEPKKCSCGATDGNALGHSFANGSCSRCGAKDPDYITPISQKQGRWISNIISNNDIATVEITVSSLIYSKGQSYDSVPQDKISYIREDDCKTINGVKYWFFIGDGININVTEEGKTVTVGLEDSNCKIILARTGEDSMSITSFSGEMPSYLPTLSVGNVFTFTAE